MSIDMIWSESDVDLVVLVFFSACLLVFFFFFLGSESSTCFLDLRDLVLSLLFSLIFFCFLLVFRTVSETSFCFVASPCRWSRR